MALGDTIEKITKATGLKMLVNGVYKAVGSDCGCQERKEELNNPNLLINKIFYKDGVSNEKGSLRNGQHPNL
jgi:hypothetical protein